jgi:hypothetical protein
MLRLRNAFGQNIRTTRSGRVGFCFEYCLAGLVFVRFEYFVVTPSGGCVVPKAIFWTTKYSKLTKRDRAVQGAWGAFKMEGSEGGVVDVLGSGLGEAR